jgi:hypothetical protein
VRLCVRVCVNSCFFVRVQDKATLLRQEQEKHAGIVRALQETAAKVKHTHTHTHTHAHTHTPHTRKGGLSRKNTTA